jgi:hypothetical protein
VDCHVRCDQQAGKAFPDGWQIGGLCPFSISRPRSALYLAAVAQSKLIAAG